MIILLSSLEETLAVERLLRYGLRGRKWSSHEEREIFSYFSDLVNV